MAAFELEAPSASMPSDTTTSHAHDLPPLWLIWGVAVDAQTQTRDLIKPPPHEDTPWIAPLFEALETGPVRWLWPLFDLEDQLQAPLPVLEAGLDEAVLDASARYQADGVVMLRLEINEHGACQARWQVRQRDMSRRWHTHGADIPACVQEGLILLSKPADALFAPILAEIPAPPEDTPPAAEQVILIAIDGIRSYGDMLHLRQLMARQAQVYTVKINAVYPQRVILQAMTAMDPAALARGLASLPTLEPLPTHAVAASSRCHDKTATTQSRCDDIDAAGAHHHFLGFRLIP